MAQVTVIYSDGQRVVYNSWDRALRSVWWNFVLDEVDDELCSMAAMLKSERQRRSKRR